MHATSQLTRLLVKKEPNKKDGERERLCAPDDALPSKNGRSIITQARWYLTSSSITQARWYLVLDFVSIFILFACQFTLCPDGREK